MPDAAPSTQQEFADLMAWLRRQDSPDAIAEMLLGRGITGTPHDPCKCPLARLIQPYLGDGIGVFNTDPNDDEYDRRAWIADERGREIFDLDDRAVLDFMDGFDTGDYPQLVARA